VGAENVDTRGRPSDRRCRRGALDNPLRRRLAPPGRELDALGIAPGMTVADLGAGVGYILPTIAARVGRSGAVWCVDPDARSLEFARRRAVDGTPVKFAIASATAVAAIPSATVDRVLLSLVLCCLQDKEGAMDEAWRILRPAGRALVTWPRRFLPRIGLRRHLQLDADRWGRLRARHPWSEAPAPRGLFVHRHLLVTPEEAT
jgi:SAM-dependent methyltransferase